jgi:hypothetical protein
MNFKNYEESSYNLILDSSGILNYLCVSYPKRSGIVEGINQTPKDQRKFSKNHMKHFNPTQQLIKKTSIPFTIDMDVHMAPLCT